MSEQRDFYLTRAAEAHAEAETATLVNVRERALRAEVSWNQMAQRVAKVERMRSARSSVATAAATGGEGGLVPVPRILA